MSYECFVGKDSKITHEAMGFRELNRLLKDAFKNHAEHIVLLGNFYIERTEIDAAILKPDGIIIIDLKDYGGSLLEANKFDKWYCISRDNQKIPVKGGSYINPYEQVSTNCKRFVRYFLNRYRTPIPGLGFSQSMIYFSDKMDNAKKLWKQNFGDKKNRFFISTIDTILGDVKDISSSNIAINKNHIDIITKTLGLKRYEDLDKFDNITNKKHAGLVDDFKSKYERAQKERDAYRKLSEERKLNLENEKKKTNEVQEKVTSYSSIAKRAVTGLQQQEHETKKERLRAEKEKSEKLEALKQIDIEKREKEKEKSRGDKLEKLLNERDLKSKEEPAFKQERIVAEKGGNEIIYSPTLNLSAVNNDIPRGRYGSLCTELVFSDGQKKYIKLETFDPKLEVTNKAKELIGKNVQVSTWVSEDINWSQLGYFNNIYESNKPVERSKIISFNAPQSVKIIKVSLENGRKYKSNWSKPMYEVQTELGIFIAATIKNHQPLEKQGRFIEWDKEQGKTLKVWTYSDSQVKELFWIGAHPEAKSSETSLDDEIPF